MITSFLSLEVDAIFTNNSKLHKCLAKLPIYQNLDLRATELNQSPSLNCKISQTRPLLKKVLFKGETRESKLGKPECSSEPVLRMDSVALAHLGI